MNFSSLSDELFTSIIPLSAAVISALCAIAAGVLSFIESVEKVRGGAHRSTGNQRKKKVKISMNKRKNTVSISLSNVSEQDIDAIVKGIHEQIDGKVEQPEENPRQ